MRFSLAILAAMLWLTHAAAQENSLPLDSWWDDLVGQDGPASYQALWRLVDRPKETVAYFDLRLKPAVAPDPARVRQLLNDLRSDKFPLREKAKKDLEQLGELIEDALKTALQEKLPLEAQRRIEGLLERAMGMAAFPHQRLASRGVEVLEIIGSEEARRLLQKLAKGAPQALLTRQANAALVRLAHPPSGTKVPQPPPQVDIDGSPLPRGAIARLGSRVLRYPGTYFGGHVFFGPDGKTINCWILEHDNTLYTFHRATGKFVKEVKMPYGEFALSPDGKKLVVASDGAKSSQLWSMDWPEGKPALILDIPTKVGALAFLSKNEVALAGSDGFVRVVDLQAKFERLKKAMPFKADGSCHFSANGATLAVYERSNQYKLFLWDWQKDTPVRTIRASVRPFQVLRFSPNGKILATSSDDEASVRLWDVASGKLLRRLSTDGIRYGRDLCFSADNKTLASLHYEGKVALWDVATGKIRRELPPHSVSGKLTISADCRYLAATDSCGIKLWDLTNGQPLFENPGHFRAIDLMAFSPRGDLLATAGDDATVCLWDPASGSLRQTFKLDLFYGTCRAIAFSRDGKLIAASGMDNTVRIWETATGKERHRLVGHGIFGGRRAVSFSLDEKQLHSWGDDFYLRTFDVATGKCIRESRPLPKGLELPSEESLLGDPYYKFGVEGGGFEFKKGFFYSGQLLLVTADGVVDSFDIVKGMQQSSVKLQFSRLWHFEPSPDGRYWIIDSFHTGTLEVVEVATGKARFHTRAKHSRPVWSRDSRTFAYVANGEITLRETATGEVRCSVPIELAKRHLGVRSLALSPDGRLLIVGLADSTALVYDLAQLANPTSTKKAN